MAHSRPQPATRPSHRAHRPQRRQLGNAQPKPLICRRPPAPA